jgi:hypothetical protein
MKHIKKKAIQHYPKTPGLPEGTRIIEVSSEMKTPSKNQNEALFLLLDNEEFIRGFQIKRNGNLCNLPFPDLTLVYYDTAYNLNKTLKTLEKEIFKNNGLVNYLDQIEFHNIYRFYGVASSCIISLFTTLESFVNQEIPDDYIYKKQTSKCEEFYNKDQIQKFIQFDEKYKKILPLLIRKNSFDKAKSIQNQHINNLKDIRNEIIHPKSSHFEIKKEQLIIKILNFNYVKCLIAVKEFLNYHRPGYIEDCPCEEEY